MSPAVVIMRKPAEHRALVITDQDSNEWPGITYSKERGFFEPITNGTCASVGITVVRWRYDKDNSND